MQALVDKNPMLTEISRARDDEAVALAYLSGQHTMAAIATHFDMHYTTVSRLVKAYEGARGREM